MQTLLLALTLLSLSAASAAPVMFKVVEKSSLNLMTVDSQTSVENLTGRTSEISGTVNYDAAAKTGSGTLILNGASIKTGMGMRDGHMKSADWLNFDKEPNIKFQTTEVKYVSGDQYDVTGTLTMHGVTKPVKARATVKFTAANADTKAAGVAGDALALTTSFPVKLSDYGVKNSKIGRQVNDSLTISIKLIASSK